MLSIVKSACRAVAIPIAIASAAFAVPTVAHATLLQFQLNAVSYSHITEDGDTPLDEPVQLTIQAIIDTSKSSVDEIYWDRVSQPDGYPLFAFQSSLYVRRVSASLALISDQSPVAAWACGRQFGNLSGNSLNQEWNIFLGCGKTNALSMQDRELSGYIPEEQFNALPDPVSTLLHAFANSPGGGSDLFEAEGMNRFYLLGPLNMSAEKVPEPSSLALLGLALLGLGAAHRKAAARKSPIVSEESQP